MKTCTCLQSGHRVRVVVEGRCHRCGLTLPCPDCGKMLIDPAHVALVPPQTCPDHPVASATPLAALTIHRPAKGKKEEKPDARSVPLLSGGAREAP